MHRHFLDGPINFYHSFWWSNLILCVHNVDILNICMKEFGLQKILLTKWQLWELRQFFRIVSQRGYPCSIIVHTRADQLLPQILIEHFDTLPTQCRQIKHMHEGVWYPKKYYWQNGSYENFDIFQACINKKGLCLFFDSAYTGQSTPNTAFDGAIWHFAYTM